MQSFVVISTTSIPVHSNVTTDPTVTHARSRSSSTNERIGLPTRDS